MKAVVALAGILLAPFLMPGGAAEAAPDGDDEAIAFVVRGVGNGHGRGMSQWGAYGRALAGQTWGEILAAYYGGTRPGNRVEPHMRVRLTGWDGAGTLGVVSTEGSARWNDEPTDYSSLYATERAQNRFDVYGVTTGLGCPGGHDLVVPTGDLQQGSQGVAVEHLQRFLNYFGFDAGPVDGDFGPLTAAGVSAFQADRSLTADGMWRRQEVQAAQALVDAEPEELDWQLLGSNVRGPITFSTTVDETSADPGAVLGVCEGNGAVEHFRGRIELHDVVGTNRVVNDLDVENYLRGVVPKEVSASWGDAAGGDGMHALRAQAVAARSFGLSQARYTYAATCDTPSCQVYGGSASRSSPTAAVAVPVEHANTDRAISDTAGVVRVWEDSDTVVSTEFSASNGPRTAGSSFPAIDDPFDDVPANPNHRWTRVIDADAIRSRYGLASANGVTTRRDTTPLDPPYEGIWANEVRLGEGRAPVSAWDFRNAFGLPSPGFELIPIRRDLTDAADFAFIGDSVGFGIVDCCGANLKVLTEGVFSSARFDALGARPTRGSGNDGVRAARRVPVGTDVVVVELGYNDPPSVVGPRIDAVMSELRDRRVGVVAWLSVSERSGLGDYATTNDEIRAAASRWDEMIVFDWESASDHDRADRWFSDGIHLTTSGNAEFAVWLRDQIVDLIADGYTPPTPPRPVVPDVPLRVPVLGVGGVPESEVSGVALNVTAVDPVGPGWLRVWPCGSDQPVTSSVNYAAGGVEPNAVVVPVDDTGEVCVSTKQESDVVVDVSAWFDAGLQGAVGRLVDTRVSGAPVEAGEVLRVAVLGREGVPESEVSGVALNVTAVDPVGPGWLRVWPCGSDQPVTSSVNYGAGGVEPNAVVVPVDDTGEVCVVSKQESDVVVDVSAWFDAGLQGVPGDRTVDTRFGIGPIPAR